MKTIKNIQPKVLLVARVSDVEQRKALPAQKKRLYDYAKRCRWVEKQDFKYVEFDEMAFKENRVMVHNGKEYKHKYPPLIERALYNKCQLIKDDASP